MILNSIRCMCEVRRNFHWMNMRWVKGGGGGDKIREAKNLEERNNLGENYLLLR